VLHALRAAANFPQRKQMLRKAIGFLEASRLDAGLWRDKWHVSGYYATGRVILALAGAGQAAHRLLRPGVDWLLQTQREDGSWSEFDRAGTCEETAYALQALASLPQLSAPIRRAMAGASKYLWQRIDEQVYPELWVGKGLYAPYAVIRAAILGALYTYEKIGSHPPEQP
jgi:halimadienyl-diphosphate synthase